MTPSGPHSYTSTNSSFLLKGDDQMTLAKTFTYFAYGSNLLQQRIQLLNPSAKRYGIGKLIDYQLNFNGFTKRWKGAPATIVPKSGSSVWGALWELDMEHMASLDEQEGVTSKVYFPKQVDVELIDGTVKNCRVYQLCDNAAAIDNICDLPENQKPSKVYLKTIILGARESKLPEDYMRFLESIPHNGYDGDIGIDLKLPSIELDGNKCKK